MLQNLKEKVKENLVKKKYIHLQKKIKMIKNRIKRKKLENFL